MDKIFDSEVLDSLEEECFKGITSCLDDVPDFTYKVPEINYTTKIKDMFENQKRRERRKTLLGVGIFMTVLTVIGIIQYKDIGKFNEEA